MKGQRAAVRYAKSFMDLAKEKSLLDGVRQDVLLILDAIEESRELKNFLHSPLIKIDKKKEIIHSIFEGKIHELSLRFIQQIADKKREDQLAQICEQFIALYNQENNIATVQLTTATKLNQELKDEILDFVRSHYQFSSVDLEERIDEELIGGLVMRIGDKQIDGSIKRKLQDIKQELTHA